MISLDSPRLIADIGGTYARFALEAGRGEFSHVVSLRSADYPDFYSAVSAYLKIIAPIQVEHAAVAIANPVHGDEVSMTNYHWHFSIEQTRIALGLDTLVIVNDFTALAMAVPRLGQRDLRQIGEGQASKSVIGILGPGSGLGVSGLIPAGDGWISLGSEGGHTSFAPRNEREIAVLRYAWKFFDHVSFERLLSGPGLELCYQALTDLAGLPVLKLSAPEITQRALEQNDALCQQTLDLFCDLLGTAAANLAVTLGAFGGIYIGGGIVPRLGDYFDRSSFRQRFEEKGRFSRYVAAIPTFVITAENATFIGASAILDAQLRAMQSNTGSPILGQIRRARTELSPAELRVADYVLTHPRAALNDPIAEIAKAAEVSQPTVIRFCRSLGCEGLSDFKLRLASGLTGTVPVTHTQVTADDSMLELGAKVLGNTASAILQVRSELNRDMIDKAIELLLRAERVEFFAVGHYGVVAQDAQFKFLRFGVPSGANTDQRLQMLAASVMRPGDVAVIISSSGRLPELLEVVEKARERGAAIVAITASQSPLARKADAALLVDHVEDISTHLPMISRILHLLVIDILAVGMAMRREPGRMEQITVDERLDELDKSDRAERGGRTNQKKATRNTAPGVSMSSPLSPLARLTSHSR